MIRQLTDQLQSLHTNIYRVGVYRDGRYQQQELQPSSACHNIYSISKNFTAAAVAVASAEGLIDLEAPMIRYLGKYLPDNFHPRYTDVLVRHLLCQRTGLAKGSLFEDDRYLAGDRNWITRVLSRPLPYPPDGRFVYDNGNYYMLACIVEQVAKMPLTQFLSEKLFDAMDIHEYAWERCPLGHCMGATGLYMRLEDLCKFGWLCLNDGVWDGRRLLPEGWIEKATRPRSTFEDGTGYGYGFWLPNADDFMMTGAHGQLVYISRRHHFVVGIQAYQDDVKIERAVAEWLA